MFNNMLIEGSIEKVFCEDIKESIAWAMIKAIYEECDSGDKPVWVYIDEVEIIPDRLREIETAFCISYTDSIQFLKSKFENALRKAREG